MTGGDPTGTFGSVCVAGTGTLNGVSGGQHIAGNYLAEPGATTPGDVADFTDGEVVLDADLSTAIGEANSLATTIAAASCTHTLTDGDDLYGIFDTTNKNVICFTANDIVLNSHITLTGSGTHPVYIKMQKLTFSSTFTIMPPLRVDQVVWYLTAGDTASGSGEISGTILHTGGKVDLSDAVVTGSIIGAGDIKLTGSSSVGCPLNTLAPTTMHSDVPSKEPSTIPSGVPTVLQSDVPSIEPSRSPSRVPSSVPSDIPTVLHSNLPSIEPSRSPSSMPSTMPSGAGVERRERKLTQSVPTSLLSFIVRRNFSGASGPVSFGSEFTNGRNAEGITVGVYHLQPHPPNSLTGNRTYDAVLASTWNESAGLVFQDGSSYPTGVLRRVIFHNYIWHSSRVIGLSLMLFSWLLSISSIVLIQLFRKDPAVQRAQPIFMQILCSGSLVLSSAIFTVSFDEDAGWANRQLSIACSVTPWLLFIGHSLILSSLFVKLWRVDRYFHFEQKAVAVGYAGTVHSTSSKWHLSHPGSISHFSCTSLDTVRPLLAFLAVNLVILLSQTVYDPWSWERRIISEIPAETYGMCQSKHDLMFFGLLVGLIFVAEAMILRVAWRTTDVPTDFRDSGSILYSCFVHIQAWAVGIPMLAALGYSSVNSTYFARIFLTWIFSVSSVAVVVFPKIWIALHSHQDPLYSQRRRARLRAEYEPSTNYDERSNSFSLACAGESLSASKYFPKIQWRPKGSHLNVVDSSETDASHRSGWDRESEVSFMEVHELNLQKESQKPDEITVARPHVHAASQYNFTVEMLQSPVESNKQSPLIAATKTHNESKPKCGYTDYIHGEQAEL